MAVTKYESYYAKISENIKGIREYNEYNTDSLAILVLLVETVSSFV